MDLLLLHGALGSRDQLRSLKKALPDLQVELLEFSGHGDQKLEAGLRFEDLISDIQRVLERSGASEPVDLFGYSMGGYAALVYASRFPDRVRSVVTLGTKLKWDREGLDRELKLLDPQKITEKVPQFAAKLSDQHGAEKWEGLVKNTADLITSLHERPLLTREVLENIQCPVMLCAGDRDRTAIPEHTLEAVRSLKYGSVSILPDTPHPYEAVALDLLIPHLRAFWRRSGDRS